MPRTEALQGLRMRRVYERIRPLGMAELNEAEASELLGVGERTFRRWRRRYEEEGEAGLVDRRLGKASGKRVPVDREEEVARLYKQHYDGFTAKHFHEQLVTRHGFAWGYTWTKRFCRRALCSTRLPRGERIGANGRVGRCLG